MVKAKVDDIVYQVSVPWKGVFDKIAAPFRIYKGVNRMIGNRKIAAIVTVKMTGKLYTRFIW